MSTSGKFVLDTNIVIGIFASDSLILQRVRSNRHIFLPSIVLGELFYGALLSEKSKSNVIRIEEFSSKCPILNCDHNTSFFYASIKSKLKSAGKPIPENDIWIAALTIQHKMKLATRDRHFDFIEGPEKEEW